MNPIFMIISNEDGKADISIKELEHIIDYSYRIGLSDAKQEIKEHFMGWKHGKQILKDIDDVMENFYKRMSD